MSILIYTCLCSDLGRHPTYPQVIDKGTWKLVTALEEYTDARWNFDGEGTIVDYAPRKIDVPEEFEISVEGDHPQQLEAHGMLPLCAGNVAGDVPGRLVTSIEIPFASLRTCKHECGHRHAHSGFPLLFPLFSYSVLTS